MRLDFARLAPCLFASLLATGCPDDPAPGGEGGGSSSTGEASSTGAAQTGVVSAESTAADGDGTSTGGDSSSGEPPTEVTISGTIQDFFAMVPITDAQISVLGLPEFETTSDADGNWEMPSLPVDTFDRFAVADTEMYWGAIVPFQTEFELIEEFELSQVSLDVIDLQIQALQAQDPEVMVEDDTGVFLIALENNTAVGAVVEIDPPPPEGTYYAPDASGQPILNNNEIQWSIYPVAVVFNLPPGPEGTYEITVTHPTRECTVQDPEPPTVGRYINLIRVQCLEP